MKFDSIKLAVKQNPALAFAILIGILAVLYLIYKQNNSGTQPINQDNTTSNPPIAEVYAFDVTPPGPSTPVTSPPTPTSGGGTGVIGTGGGITSGNPTPPTGVQHPIGTPIPSPVTPVQNQPSRTQIVGSWPAWNSTLWGIAEHYYGNGEEYTKIYNANKGTIGNNPDLLHPGEVLTIP